MILYQLEKILLGGWFFLGNNFFGFYGRNMLRPYGSGFIGTNPNDFNLGILLAVTGMFAIT